MNSSKLVLQKKYSWFTTQNGSLFWCWYQYILQYFVLLCKLRQHVSGLTHQWGHAADVAICRESSPSIVEIPFLWSLIDCQRCEFSDNHLVQWLLINMDKPSFLQKRKTYRKCLDTNMFEFEMDLFSIFVWAWRVRWWAGRVLQERCPAYNQPPCFTVFKNHSLET